jgi:ParB-like nuclease domain
VARRRRGPVEQHEPELVPIDELREHERNYRRHDDEQVRHIEQSIREHGFYRNVVVANDGTILAGHGVVRAARRVGLKTVRIVRLKIGPDDPQALKLLVADNELARFAGVDDRQLSELLKEVSDFDVAGLLGTGYDEQQLANLIYVTRPRAEVGDYQDAAAWVGMPEFETGAMPFKLIVLFETEDEREQLMQQIGATVTQQRNGRVWSIWWPEREREDPASLRFDDAA